MTGLTDRDPRELAGAWTRYQEHAFADPAPELAGFVRSYWAVRWRYATPYRQKIVPAPMIGFSVTSASPVRVHGVATRFVLRELRTQGWATGAVLQPGVARCLLRGPVSALTDRVAGLEELADPPADGPELVGTWPDPGPEFAPAAVFRAWDRWLRPQLAGLVVDAAGRSAAAAVAAVSADPSLRRVDDLAQHCGIGVRRLQRLFADHVGASPKWVLRRSRLQEVTDVLAAGGPVDWAGLAADLGYADQAHLTRDFAAIFGEPPTAWARRYPDR
ncbi:helix-turn-helix domain-containing protein [Nakamurella leprariae]|uniref:AraC family transcriptional regulator n=1 Tax=Nakamurella leprariae TaxID=2803911 RepID=A0A938YB94_9ACTN|nr:helix-turn-helix domain-containing protein [Nakamurella leprariae]MBM9466624.1 AraC family transcriptional regulator [Nakamurella leprariae]